jgi:hypothetical protein
MATITGYKLCQGDLLVTLQIFPEAWSNLGREKLVNPLYAKYRCEWALVKSIARKDGRQLKTAWSCFCPVNQTPLLYEVGQVVEVKDTNRKPNVVCTSGIHFYLSADAAWSLGRCPTKKWFEDGALALEEPRKNGYLHGIRRRWGGESRKLIMESSWRDGLLHGLTRKYRHGQVQWESRYVAGERVSHVDYPRRRRR